MATPEKKSTLGVCFMLVLAAVLLVVAERVDNPPDIADHRFLVAAPGMPPPWEKSVILMLRQRKTDAFGLIVNGAEKNGVRDGGPVDTDDVNALHSLDVTFAQDETLDDLHLAVLKGKEAVAKLAAARKKPKWYIVIRGHVRWRAHQLNAEIQKGAWQVVNYDGALLTGTSGAEMWEQAIRQPAIPAQ